MNILSRLSQISPETGNSWMIVFIAFSAGILVSFTPCIYPMIPITAGILRSQASSSLINNLAHAFAYVIGIALVYASLGYLSAKSSLIFGSWMASPWFLGIMVGLFVYLAFSMFGFYEIYTPRFFNTQNPTSSGPSVLRSLLLGLAAGSVASPCLTPALAILLGLVAKQANPILGFAALFSFALGMSMLLMLVGVFSSSMSHLPRAGEWMEDIKYLFGFLMLGSCFYFLQPFFAQYIIIGAYGVLSGIAAYIFFRFGTSPVSSRIFGSIALIGAAISFCLSVLPLVFR